MAEPSRVTIRLSTEGRTIGILGDIYVARSRSACTTGRSRLSTVWATALLLPLLAVNWYDETLAQSAAPLGDRPAEKTGFVPSFWFEGPPKVTWQFTSAADQRGRSPGVSDPATAGGMLFFGDDDGVMRAFTSRGGVPIWTHQHGTRVFYPPTCDDERVYFTTRKGITALERSTGIVLWNRAVSHSAGRCVVWRETGAVFFSDSDGWTYGLDATTGELKWRTSFIDDAPKDPPGFDGDRARFDGTKARPSGIATDGLAVYQSVFDQCRVVAFDCKTGERRAVFQTQGWIFGDPAVDDERLFVGSQDRHLYCFDKATGEVLWKHETGSRIESGPAVTADRVVMPSCDGKVYCHNKETGDQLWVFTTDNPRAIYSAPIVTMDSVYFAASEGTVYGLDLENGEVRWKLRPSPASHFYTSPATDGTRIFVKSRPQNDELGESAVYAIGPSRS